MRLHKHIILFVLLTSYIFNANANLKSNIKHTVESYKKTHTLNATYLFADNKHALVKGAHGDFSFEKHISLKPNQSMPIASCTKPMTAVAILMLQDRGLLNVSDTIAQHLPSDSNVWPDNKLPSWAHSVTLHDLLTHTSGIAEYIPNINLDPKKSHREINKDIIKYATEKSLMFKTGAKYSYCNTGYTILGLIIEHISKKTFAQFMQDEMFKPLKMKHTFVASTEIAHKYQEGQLNNKYPVRYFATPTGSTPVFTVVLQHFFLSPFADGGIISNAKDLYKWNRALHEGKLLSAKSYKMMLTPYIKADDSGYPDATDQGYGMRISKLPNGNLLYHHGGNAIAIRSEYGYIPSQNFYFAILSNVMVHVPDDMKDKVDFNLPANQIDIMYFRNNILNTIK